MSATLITTITPAEDNDHAIGQWLVNLSLDITSTIPATNVATNGLPHFDLTWTGPGGHTIILPNGPDEIESLHSVCFLFETTDEADTLAISGESFEIDTGQVNVVATVSLVLVGTPEEETTEATRTTIKPGSKLHIYRQNDSR